MPEAYFRISPTAKQLGVTIQTIKRWLVSAKIHSVRTVGGEHRFAQSEIDRLLGKTSTSANKKTVIYARVSSHDQKNDMITQVTMLEQYAITKGYANIIKLSDIGSGLNPNRIQLQKLFKLIDTEEVGTIIVSYKDRLSRFGFEYLNAYFRSHHAQIVVMNVEEVQDPQHELTQDLISIITSFSGKIYGLRSHKAKKLVEAMQNELQH